MVVDSDDKEGIVMYAKLLRVALPWIAVLAVAAVAAPTLIGRASDGPRKGPRIRPAEGATFTTLFRSPLGVEGLTADRHGNLYSAGRGGDPCPVWRVPATGGSATVVGNVPAPCSPSGIAFDARGDLYIADGDQVFVLEPNSENPPTADVFADGVPGANGIAFDRRGSLWVSDGTTGAGRVWRVGLNGEPAEIF